MENHHHPARELGKFATAVASIAALGGLGLGGFATLETDNEVGTAAAFAVGLFFAIVALIGRVPKVKLGDNEIDPTTAYRAGIATGADSAAAVAEATRERGGDVEEVVSAAQSVSDAISEHVERTGSYDIARMSIRDREVERIVDRTLDRVQESHQYELRVAGRIVQMLPIVDPDHSISVLDNTTNGPGGRGVADLEFAAATRTGYIEVLWTTQPLLDRRRIRDFCARLADPKWVRQDLEPSPALVISNVRPARVGQSRSDHNSPNLELVTWRDERDDARLEAALASFVELLR